MKPQKLECSSEYYIGPDRLSEMPDEVIVHILSYLPTVDAVRTILIRPFGNLWTLVPTLDFNVEKVLGKLVLDDFPRGFDVRRFFIFVRNVLLLHKRPSIDEFCLRLDYQYDGVERSGLGDDIRMCLKFALDKQAKVIYFCDGHEYSSKSSDYPNFISQSLVTLTLSSCLIYPELQVNLGSLKKLILEDVTMSEEAFQQFICGCPSLQELHIYKPFDIRNLSFNAPNIRKLFLELEEHEPDDDDHWLLDFPNLQSLYLELYRIPNVDHIDISSVRDVYIRELCFKMDDGNKIAMFKLFLAKFSQTEVFRLSEYASETFLHLLDDLHLLQIRWKRVHLPLPIFCQSCLLGVYQLIRSSKDMEKLDIYTTTSSAFSRSVDLPIFQASADLLPVELTKPCVIPKLKTVTLHGYAKPWKHHLQLVKFLLKSAIVLEKLVIVPNKPQLTVQEKLDKLDFVTLVSRLQRSSPSARVIFV